jgi:integrase
MEVSIMAKSSKKPDLKKPHPDFPLFPHKGTNRWAKKIKGKIHYFGKVLPNDPKGEKALETWLDQKDDLLAGRTPRAKGDGLTVADLANHFLTFKQELRDSGELAPRSYDEYHATCEMVVGAFGRNRLVDDLAADDFQALRARFAKRFGPVRLGNSIQRVRSLFKYGYEAGLIDKPPRFGPGFKKPSAKTIRKSRAANGPRMFQADELRRLLDHATPNMRAMILLGVNGGLGNTDVAELTTNVADTSRGWFNYPRPKTGIERRIPLWPETIEAIDKALAARPAPKEPADVSLTFIGRRGQNYIGNHKGYRVHQEFARVAEKAGVEGRSFYDLRRTFQTIAEGARDLVAVQAIMGQAPSSGDMSAIYRQRVDDERLRAAVEHVRRWLFASGDTEDVQSNVSADE